MCRKLFVLTSFVLVLALAGTNVVFAGRVWEDRISDDAEEGVPGGGINTGSSDLEMPYEGTGKATPQVIGLRFSNVGIPQGASIAKAYVEFQCDEIKGGTEPVSLLIEGELSPNAAAFADVTNNVTSRPRTTAQVVWVPANWTGVGQIDQTLDIASIIEEIINQPGWASGNALALIISDDPANPSEGVRCAEAGPGTQAAKLHVEWSVSYAMDPDPADGAIGGPAPLLQWTAGDTAVWHDVYFGTNPELGPDAYMERMPYPMYWHIPGFTPGTTYYWRIDEVEADGTTITGNVWSFLAAPLIAYNPDPPDGTKTAQPDAPLSWASGATAAMHDVYFGTSRADVAAGTGETFKGNQIDNTYAPEGLLTGTAYFWRIDEVEANGTTKHTGDVWSFRTLDDPAFIGWWKFDEGEGDIAYDSSGFGHHGIVQGNKLWTPNGAIDGALELDGSDDFVAIDPVHEHMTSNNFSVSAWIKTEQMDDGNVFASNFGGSHDFIFGVINGNVLVEADSLVEFPPKVADNRWHMITYVRDGDTAYVYTDGVQVGKDIPSGNPAGQDLWSIGQEWDSSPSDEYQGLVDDARFWIRPLTAEEVAAVFKGDVDLAHSPSPANNSTVDVDRAKLPLTWSPGAQAAQHDVYFGTDELAVDGADASDTSGIYRGRQTAVSYTPTEALEWGTGPYYWRIDEYNTDTTVATGKVWSFTVADFLIVDDIESYNDLDPADPASNRIFNVWLDGYGVATNGSLVGYENPPFCEQSIVHGGRQSMPFAYDNSGTASYSEATLTLTQRDWIKEGVGTLTVWFRGDSANTAAPMYITLNGTATVTHGDPDAALIGAWTQWNIPLTEFSNQGVGLTNVSSITIGLGNKTSPQPSGSGMMFFDDIRLYR
ncbi:MAG: LamG domain-containing protein [Planctomycetota bacterium]|jgi:hypothetical protein